MLFKVFKRSGEEQPVDREKIARRVTRCVEAAMLSYADPARVADKACQGLCDGMTTQQVDDLLAESAAYLCSEHPDYGVLAARLAVSSLHRSTSPSFVETMQRLRNYFNPHTREDAPLVAEDVMAIIKRHAKQIEDAIDYERDFSYDFFGFRTLMRSYLLQMHGEVVERPQHMLMRVSIGIHKNDIERALETYDMMSRKMFTHASPTLFNAGTPINQLSSCFLLTMKDDSIEGIYDTLKQCAMISKTAGGVGLNVHCIRATGSYVRGTNGKSNGIVPMLRVFNNTARYVDQGGGKRKGAFAIYLEPWHADIFDFLELRKNHGDEEGRARDLFYALWIPDLFMKRVKANGKWSLMCPDQCRRLADCHGKEFEALYEGYEKRGKVRKTIKAQDLWFKIIESQIETGTPYMLYKDTCNALSNQKNLGTIKCSNLCTEIIEYSSPKETAVCNLASVSLPSCVENGEFNHEKLRQIVCVMTRNLDRIIDVNHYPTPETKRSNFRHRPLGLGVQGLADVFIMLRMPFESEEARKLNREIFETIYYAAMTESIQLAYEMCPYDSFDGSPASRGILQFDMWEERGAEIKHSGRWDWDKVKAGIKEHGLRNSLLVAPMPTASTAQILGNNEAFEPYTSNIYSRRVLAGEFTVVNKHLIKELVAKGLWSSELKNKVLQRHGSVQGIPEIPEDVQKLYKTVWEIKQRVLVDLAADRGPYVDQSQSFNVHIPAPNAKMMSSLHFYTWSRGLKTGMYYLRTKPAAAPIQFTVDKSKPAKIKSRRRAAHSDSDLPMLKKNAKKQRTSPLACSREADCVSCSG